MSKPSFDQIKLIGRSAIELRWQVSDPRIKVGRGTYGDPRIVLYSADDRVTIGNFSSIAGGSTLLAGGEHHYKTTSTYPFRYFTREDRGPEEPDPLKIRYHDARHKGALTIGSDVWVGFDALILSGVTVGHGAVVGAGAVVAKDVPPFSIVVGNPGRVAKMRFESDVIDRLLQVRWWDWDPTIILNYKAELMADPAGFLALVDRIKPDELATYYAIDPANDAMEFEEIPPPSPASGSLARRFLRGLTPPALVGGIRSIRTAARSLSRPVDHRENS